MTNASLTMAGGSPRHVWQLFNMWGVPASLTAQRQPQEHCCWDLNTQECTLQLAWKLNSFNLRDVFHVTWNTITQLHRTYFSCIAFENPNAAAQASFLHHGLPSLKSFMRASSSPSSAPTVSSHTEQSSLSSQDWAHTGGNAKPKSGFINSVKRSTGTDPQKFREA